MSDEGESSFGLELIIFAHSQYFTRKADALTCLVHWKLLTEGRLRCVGTGEVFSVSSSSNEYPPSEILRQEAFFKGKSENCGGVSVKYRGIGDEKASKYLLKMTELDEETIVLNLIRISDEKVITLKFDPNKIISDSFNSIQKEIVDVLFPKEPKATAASSKVDKGVGDEERGFSRPIVHPVHVPPRIPRRPYPDIIDPPSFGHGDLEPFSRDDGGMLMDPFGGVGIGRRRDPDLPNFDPPFPGMRGRGGGGFPHSRDMF
ncbi:PSMF1 [Lepeophtheirus salmonis]|uniref:Proteasome inhibitor PI31 subunit n=1 Tax=Lepeophtheirus salmonis TaxID=72036 RepID=A0A7R8H160_LEPSM|nr:PSMF1 [Lepeophtheirus salmonis]CAF2783103.1 PSMF1 [Lepeophtheirus salmonis]